MQASPAVKTVKVEEHEENFAEAPALDRASDEVPELLHPPGEVSWLGVELSDVGRGVAGVRVRSVLRGSPAFRAGLERDDVLLALDEESLSRPEEVHRGVREKPPGTRVAVLFDRQGEQRLVSILLDGLPDAEDLARLRFVGLKAPELGPLGPVQGLGPWEAGGLQGKVVIVEFWARFCAVCRYLVPVMNRWHRQYRPQGAVLLGITSDPVLQADRAARELRVAYPVASDRTGHTTRAFAADQLPTVFVVDRRGFVRDVMVGLSEPRLREIEKLVEQLLDES